MTKGGEYQTDNGFFNSFLSGFCCWLNNSLLHKAGSSYDRIRGRFLSAHDPRNASVKSKSHFSRPGSVSSTRSTNFPLHWSIFVFYLHYAVHVSDLYAIFISGINKMQWLKHDFFNYLRHDNRPSLWLEKFLILHHVDDLVYKPLSSILF